MPRWALGQAGRRTRRRATKERDGQPGQRPSSRNYESGECHRPNCPIITILNVWRNQSASSFWGRRIAQERCFSPDGRGQGIGRKRQPCAAPGPGQRRTRRAGGARLDGMKNPSRCQLKMSHWWANEVRNSPRNGIHGKTARGSMLAGRNLVDRILTK